MSRLYVVVEGQTEEAFVERVLAPHLRGFGLETFVRIVTSARDPKTGAKRRGGGSTFGKWHNDLANLMDQQARGHAWVTTLFDLYGLPDDFPGLEASHHPHHNRAEFLEGALRHLINEAYEHHGWRFIPYIQRYEMETLVLASLPALAEWLDTEEQLAGLKALAAEIEGLAPEDVNDGKETAPSKRLLRHVPGYSKVIHGPDAIELTGLAAIRAACPRFNAWITALEGLNAPQA